MPTYNYHCDSCDTTQEHFHLSYALSKQPIECSSCKTGVAFKGVSSPTILLDGSDPNFVAAHDRWVKHHEQAGNGVRTI